MSTDFYCTKPTIPLAICSMSESSDSLDELPAEVVFWAKLVKNLLNFKLERLCMSARAAYFFSSEIGTSSSTTIGRVYILGLESVPCESLFSDLSCTKEVCEDGTSGVEI